MKKLFLLLISVFLFSTVSWAQFKIGLSVQPGIVSNRIDADVDSLSYQSDGNKLKAWVGLYVDIEMMENYYFTTGIYWASKNLKLRMEGSGETQNLDLNIQYLQIPLYLKLLTDEIALDKRIYFNIGPALDIKIEESLGDEEQNLYIDKINFWDLNLQLGAGMEFKVGQNTVIVGGLSYYRGMINAIKPVSQLEDRLRIKNDFYAINLAVKF